MFLYTNANMEKHTLKYFVLFIYLIQGTLYTREGYGTICAVFNQLWA